MRWTSTLSLATSAPGTQRNGRGREGDRDDRHPVKRSGKRLGHDEKKVVLNRHGVTWVLMNEMSAELTHYNASFPSKCLRKPCGAGIGFRHRPFNGCKRECDSRESDSR